MPSKATTPSACATCGQEFYPYIHQLKKGHGLYCGRRCYGDAKITREVRVCAVCAGQINRVQSKSGPYCSRACSNRARKIPEPERAWALVNKRGPNECWPNRTQQPAYPLFTLDDGRQETLTRTLWRLLNGRALQDHEKVCHHCDHPWCCNPAHWFIGTTADNLKDRDAKGRQARGERSGMAKLTTPDILEIRSRYATGESQQSIADSFGISQLHVSNIARRVAWKHV
jgi:hypothetical protein